MTDFHLVSHIEVAAFILFFVAMWAEPEARDLVYAQLLQTVLSNINILF